MNILQVRGLDVEQASQVLKAIEKELSLMPNGQDPLDQLDCHDSSYAYLFILIRRLEVVPTPSLYEKAWQFSLQFSPIQHRLFYSELQKFVQILSTKSNAQACQILVNITERLSQGIYYTSIHECALFACLNKMEYQLALPILQDLTEFNENDSKSSKSYLKYQYYRGLILLKLRNFTGAVSAFTSALHMPGHATSSIQIEAYKKFVLVSLLLKGKLLAIPQDFNNFLMMAGKRTGGNSGSLYQKLACGVEELDFKSVQDTCTTNRSTFEEDGNTGLVNVVKKSMVSFKILELARIFVSISIAQVEQMIGKVALEFIAPMRLDQKITNMIEKGKVNGVVKDGIIFFNQNTQEPNYNMAALEREQEDLVSRLELYNKQLGLENKYLATKLPKTKSSRADDSVDEEMISSQ